MENDKVYSRVWDDTYHLIDVFQSRLGILDNQLKVKLLDEYESHKTTYELLHNRDHIILRCQLFRLAKECKQKTPENYEELVTHVLGMGLPTFSTDIMNIPMNLYPVYPSFHHNQIIEMAKLVQPYYTESLDLDFIALDLKINFYANWSNLLALSEEKSEVYWINKILGLITREPDNDKRVTISNVIRRKYPHIDEYLSSRGA